jgi:hypothetical protein
MPDDLPLTSPVFVDHTGRRRRHVRVAAVVVAGLLLGAGALVVAALLGVPVGPSAFLPEHEPAPPVATSQSPRSAATAPSGTSSHKNPAVAGERGGAPAATTPVPPAVATTTTVDKGKPDTPPGRPTGLPTPPGHSR